jgi:murein DD-endopeptidase MepM/ murein hydrolase activator NlpD
MVRRLVVVGASALLLAPAATPSRPDVSAGRYQAPVTPVRVVRVFDPPATPYGPGHRGVDLAVVPGAVVRAAAAGVVSFAATIAGRGVVVVQHPDGVRTEYEPLRVRVRTGTAVAAGAVLGTVAGRHGSCAPGRCLHWGARRGTAYFDPLLLLQPLGTVRLLPWN